MNQIIEEAYRVVQAWNEMPSSIEKTHEICLKYSKALDIVREDKDKHLNRLYSNMTYYWDRTVKDIHRQSLARERSKMAMRALRALRGKPYKGKEKKKPLTNAEIQKRWRQRHPDKARAHTIRQNRKSKALRDMKKHTS